MKDKLTELVEKFLALRVQRDKGNISNEEFRQQLQTAAVADTENPGCWWNIEPENGRWIYYDGSTWSDKTPEGFEPVALPPTVQPAEPEAPPPMPSVTPKPAAKAGGGGKALAWIIGILVVVVVVAGASIGIWFALQSSGTGGGADEDAIMDEVEEVAEDFFKALEDRDLDDLKDVIDGDMADLIEEAEEDETVDNFWMDHPFDEFEIGDIEVDDEDAEVSVTLTDRGARFIQQLELELDDDEWKVVDWGERTAAPDERDEDEGTPEVAEPDMEELQEAEDPYADQFGSVVNLSEAESEVKNTVDQFFSSLQNWNTDLVLNMSTGRFRSQFSGFLDNSEPSDLDAQRSRFGNLRWEVIQVEVSQNGDAASAYSSFELPDSSPYVEIELVREGGRWLIEALTNRYAPPSGAEEG